VEQSLEASCGERSKVLMRYETAKEVDDELLEVLLVMKSLK
jgi:hypothetical protein